MRIDIHTHILPHMDDGARDIKEALELLKTLAASGVERVVLTPHFYRKNEDIQTFLKRREKAFEELSRAVSGIKKCPELLLGAEVYFYPSLSSDPDFRKLCIEGTDFVLLELPFERFQDNFFGSFNKFMNACEEKIILAHVERYFEFGNTDGDISRLLSYGDVLCQMNCSSLVSAGIFKRKPLLKLISDGTISALGTDTHSTAHRPPMYGQAERIIVSKCGQAAFKRICSRTEIIFDRQKARL